MFFSWMKKLNDSFPHFNTNFCFVGKDSTLKVGHMFSNSNIFLFFAVSQVETFKDSMV